MSTEGAHRDAIAQMSAANPVSAARLRATIGESDLRQKMTAAIAAGSSPPGPVPVGDAFANGFGAPRIGRGGSPARRRGATLLAGMAGAGLVALVVSLVGVPGGGSHPQFATAAIEVAEANPRLLVAEPGWKIVRADEFEPDSGELTFSDGSHSFDIHWYPARLYGGYLRDRATVSAQEHGTLLGQRATTVDYGRDEYATMLSPQGSVFIEVRGQLGSKSAYDEILHSLRPVDVETWLSAMPPTTVRPEARAAAVDQLLRGLPLPPGFDPTALRNESSISDQSSLAVKVGNAVACDWVESWIAARAAGDQAAAQRAVEALGSSADWPVVRKTQVPWFSNYAIVAKQLRAGRLDRGAAGEVTKPDGTGYELGPAWAVALGCTSRYWRRPLM